MHEGVYRERINPPRGGKSDDTRIVYQAVPGEKVEIKGSELIKGWTKVQKDVWKVIFRIRSSADSIRTAIRFTAIGSTRWDGHITREPSTSTVTGWTKPLRGMPSCTLLPPTQLWFGEVNEKVTTIWARFTGVDPNKELVEINVRQTVFYPEKTGINYITVRGFTMRHAATNWAPPTAEQVGLIGPHWSKGWIIENNVISHSRCSGISLGKYGDEWDNTSANSAEGYVKTIERALKNGWNKETVGHHIIRNNTISDCEQAGIVGSLGAVFSSHRGEPYLQHSCEAAV